MKEEEWSKQALQELDHLPEARMSDTFMHQLEEKLTHSPGPARSWTIQKTWLAAASVALLLTANIFAMSQTTKTTQNEVYGDLATSYGLGQNNNPFNLEYNE
jgi:hypothetical protein